jgi:hypothetical protein
MPRKSRTYVEWITYTKLGNKRIDKQSRHIATAARPTGPQNYAGAPQLPVDIER